MKALLRLLWGLCWLVWLVIQIWWASRGDKGVEADDPDKERESLRHTGDAHGLFRGEGRRRNTD